MGEIIYTKQLPAKNYNPPHLSSILLPFYLPVMLSMYTEFKSVMLFGLQHFTLTLLGLYYFQFHCSDIKNISVSTEQKFL